MGGEVEVRKSSGEPLAVLAGCATGEAGAAARGPSAMVQPVNSTVEKAIAATRSKVAAAILSRIPHVCAPQSQPKPGAERTYGTSVPFDVMKVARSIDSRVKVPVTGVNMS
jgi:hypothetical protein